MYLRSASWKAQAVLMPAVAASFVLLGEYTKTSKTSFQEQSRYGYYSSRATTKLDAAPEDCDHLLRWKERWDANRTAFHKSQVNPNLIQFLDSDLLSDQSDVRVLVPLCGKTFDMAYLAADDRVAMVVGVEGIRKALMEFAELHVDLEIQETITKRGAFDRWIGRNILLLKGDFFDLNRKEAEGRFGAIWDRASLVAIEPSLREKYVDIFSEVIAPGGVILLSTIVRTNGDMTTGPPFSIDENEVRRLFGSRSWVESIECVSSSDASGKSWYSAFFSLFRQSSKDYPVKVFVIRAKN